MYADGCMYLSKSMKEWWRGDKQARARKAIETSWQSTDGNILCLVDSEKEKCLQVNRNYKRSWGSRQLNWHEKDYKQGPLSKTFYFYFRVGETK